MAKKSEDKSVKITLVKSTIGCLKKQKATVEALGLKKIGSSNVLKDTEVLRGMINVVSQRQNVLVVE